MNYTPYGTDPKMDKLVDSPIIDERISAAQKGYGLERLVNDNDLDVRGEVAENKFTPNEILIHLAKDHCSYIRESVAKNPNTPPLILTALAYDDDVCVRYAVSLNCNTPQSALWLLSKDECFGIVKNVIEHKNVPDKILEYYSEHLYVNKYGEILNFSDIVNDVICSRNSNRDKINDNMNNSNSNKAKPKHHTTKKTSVERD